MIKFIVIIEHIIGQGLLSRIPLLRQHIIDAKHHVRRHVCAALTAEQVPIYRLVGGRDGADELEREPLPVISGKGAQLLLREI